MFIFRTLLTAAALLLVIALPVAALTPAGIEIEPARTRVGIARVNLEISDLQLDDDRLLGTYEVKVPLAPRLNDRGRVEIRLDGSLDRLIADRGKIFGWGHSVLDGRARPISCTFGPGATVNITIDTGNRILAFKTRVQ